MLSDEVWTFTHKHLRKYKEAEQWMRQAIVMSGDLGNKPSSKHVQKQMDFLIQVCRLRNHKKEVEQYRRWKQVAQQKNTLPKALEGRPLPTGKASPAKKARPIYVFHEGYTKQSMKKNKAHFLTVMGDSACPQDEQNLWTKVLNGEVSLPSKEAFYALIKRLDPRQEALYAGIFCRLYGEEIDVAALGSRIKTQPKEMGEEKGACEGLMGDSAQPSFFKQKQEGSNRRAPAEKQPRKRMESRV